MPIPRIRLPASQLSQPIPTLTDRQYVVDKSRKSPDQIKLERELFWYRDALLKTLDATWVEVSPCLSPLQNFVRNMRCAGVGLTTSSLVQ